MKTKNILMTAAVAGAMTLAACTNNDEVTIDNLKDTPILVNTGVNELTQTRAGYDNQSLPTRFALYITQDATNDASPYNYKNVEMKYADGAWTPSNLPGGTTMLWKSATPSATVIAYNYNLGDADLAYSTALPAEKTKLTLVTDQSTAEGFKKADVLYYRGLAINPTTGGALNIPFEHIGSKIRLECKFGSEMAADAKVTACTISGETGTQSTKTYLQDILIDTATGGFQTANDGDNATAIAGMKAFVENNTAELIIFFPSLNSLKLTFTVSVGGATKIYSGIWTVNAAINPGNVGKATITIGRDKVEIGNFSASPWETGTGGNVETE